MADQKQHEAVSDVAEQINALLREAVQTHGLALAMGGLTLAVGGLLGGLDRQAPGMNALAAFLRTFSAVYDSAFYAEDVKPAGQA